ncbi:MAG: hypothetical protein GY772_27185, partial [bacterium]|nr:hypothetical protein [bacterium]
MRPAEVKTRRWEAPSNAAKDLAWERKTVTTAAPGTGAAGVTTVGRTSTATTSARGQSAEEAVKTRWHVLVPEPRPWVGNQGGGNLTMVARERPPPTVRGWALLWLADARRSNIPYQLMPEGAPWFARCPNDGTGLGARATSKVQGASAEVVAKAAATLYIGRRYCRDDQYQGTAPYVAVVDFYRRGVLDEPELYQDWAPDWFKEIPLYKPMSQARMKELQLHRLEFQGWPRVLEADGDTLAPERPEGEEIKRLLRACLVIEGSYVKRTTGASTSGNIMYTAVRCTV